MFFFRRPAACALTVTLVTLSCGLAARAQVGVTQPAPVAAVGVKSAGEIAGVTTAPTTGSAPIVTAPVVGAAAVGTVGGVRASGVNTGLLLLLGQIADGQMTLEQAWDKGVLDAPKVLQLLSQTQRFTEDTRNETLQRDLAGLLVKLAPATVATPDRLSARVRVALCRYYADKDDARAVPLCEALIAEKLDGKQINQPLASNPDGGSSNLYLNGVISLAKYYQNVGQWQKAGETWERALSFWQDVNWWQAGVRVDAARAYKRTEMPENQNKAAQLYALVPTFDNPRDTLMALYDQAYALIKDDQHKEARVLLQTPIEGANTAEVQVGLLSLLSASYLKTGEVDLAQETAQRALDTYQTVSKPTPHLGIEPQLERARKVLDWSWRYKAGNANPAAENTKNVTTADVELPSTKG